ncbi:hypothetical protein GA0116948_101124 [Chitinophaga costaii]|uniref:Uncharacterized protein n=1 Tax=Chitinophaga costaii TaxID=1335309 RepID=A0A1C3YVH4_9BACT|nr:hypothetical protein GA0116948_101124 [Chitinophaga costaii]
MHLSIVTANEFPDLIISHMPNTLIISNRDDVSIEYLISKMDNRGISHLRINSEDIGSFEFSSWYTCHYYRSVNICS